MLGRFCQGGCACFDCGNGTPDTRWRKRVEARQVAREVAGCLAGEGPDVFAERDGECRHGCNGDCVVKGIASDVCDFLCHPFLELDEGKAARLEAVVRRLERL